MNYDLLICMYDALENLGEENQRLVREYESIKDTLSLDEKKKKCDETRVSYDMFLELKPYYFKYKANPTVELENEIREKFGDVLQKTTIEKLKDDIPNNLTEVNPIEKPVALDGNKEKVEEVEEAEGIEDDIPQKPVLDDLDVDFDNIGVEEAPSVEPSTPSEPIKADGLERHTISEWCDIYGFDLINPEGFNESDVKNNTIMTENDFMNGLVASEFEAKDLSDDFFTPHK